MDKQIQLFIDFPICQSVQFKLAKEEGESFGFKKFQKHIQQLIEQ